MAQKALTAKQQQAAIMLAEDEMVDEAIANALGVGRRTLSNWKLDPLFLDAVAEQTRRIEAGMLKLAIAKRHKRMETLNDLYVKSLEVIEERAAALQNDDEAYGGGTGLIVKQYRVIGSGQNQITTTEYEVDTGLVKQIESLMERASKEMGQEVDRSSVNATYTIVFDGVDANEAL